jgi:long-chain acyl-CoA synthetase
MGYFLFCTLSYGAVAVSILHEFDKASVQFIVDHSDSKMLFVDDPFGTKSMRKPYQKLKLFFPLKTICC